MHAIRMRGTHLTSRAIGPGGATVCAVTAARTWCWSRRARPQTHRASANDRRHSRTRLVRQRPQLARLATADQRLLYRQAAIDHRLSARAHVASATDLLLPGEAGTRSCRACLTGVCFGLNWSCCRREVAAPIRVPLFMLSETAPTRTVSRGVDSRVRPPNRVDAEPRIYQALVEIHL